MAGCCSCCSALKPRYKRLVDSIFPADPEDGLVKSNMDKLTFFSMKSPEKLDRIGEYLAQRLSRDVERQRKGYVVIAMEALDLLLVTCHAQNLNLFVESFLKMIQKLLESEDPELQCLATQSFVKFAHIEEDVPSYHRRYDFFVSKFSSMSHNNHPNPDLCDMLRVSGLRGLQGVVRKTVSDDLQVNIWEKTHMDKIVPSLLYNMHDARFTSEQESPNSEEDPPHVAETVFRDLVCRGSYGNINSILKPVLTHLDNHKLWVPNDFAVRCFRVIMYSVQSGYGYLVVQQLMNHLDENSKKEAKIKASIVDVLSQTVLIAAGGSIGPSVLEVFNTLVRHLRLSVEADIEDEQMLNDEKIFQEAIVNTIGEFANNLPDYQKIEIIMFVMNKVPLPKEGGKINDKEVLLQTMIMKILLKVATKYKTVLMANAFPSAFLEPLLRISLARDPGIRRIVQEILHTLLDRHENTEKLKTVSIHKDISELDIKSEKPQRQDLMFMIKNGSLFYWHLYENMQQVNNRVDNFENLFCTMCLLCIEMGSDEVLIELVRFLLGIQNMACVTELPMTHVCAIHAIVAAVLNLISQLTVIPAFCQHITKVIESRRNEGADFFLPEGAFNRTNTAKSYPASMDMKDNWLFNTEMIGEALGSSGHDTSTLSAPYAPQPAALGRAELHNTVDFSKSNSDIHSLSIESGASTPKSVQRNSSKEEITFESLKKALETNPKAKEEAEARRIQILESFRSGPFEEIVARSETSHQFEDKVNEILDMISRPQESPGGTPRKARCEEESVPIYDLQFPELFVY